MKKKQYIYIVSGSVDVYWESDSSFNDQQASLQRKSIANYFELQERQYFKLVDSFVSRQSQHKTLLKMFQFREGLEISQLINFYLNTPNGYDRPVFVAQESSIVLKMDFDCYNRLSQHFDYRSAKFRIGEFMDRINHFCRIDTFQFAFSHLDVVAALARELVVRPFQKVYHEGDLSQHIYFIKEGELQIVKSLQSNLLLIQAPHPKREKPTNAPLSMKLATLKAPEFFGEEEIFLMTKRRYTVQNGSSQSTVFQLKIHVRIIYSSSVSGALFLRIRRAL